MKVFDSNTSYDDLPAYVQIGNSRMVFKPKKPNNLDRVEVTDAVWNSIMVDFVNNMTRYRQQLSQYQMRVLYLKKTDVEYLLKDIEALEEAENV